MKRFLLLVFIGLLFCGCSQNREARLASTGKDSLDVPERILSDKEQKIISDFEVRRKSCDEYLKQNEYKRFTCPGCGYPTLSARGEFEICTICNWEDDGQGDFNADEALGGPNYDLSLTDNRILIGELLLSKADSLGGVVNQSPDEMMISILNHERRMNSFDNEKLMNAPLDDPIWKSWREQSARILDDLIKK